MHAKGFLPENHAHWAGVIGRARRSDVKRFTDRADLIIAVGYDPIEINYEDWARNTPIVHISTRSRRAGRWVEISLEQSLRSRRSDRGDWLESRRPPTIGRRGVAKAPIVARSRACVRMAQISRRTRFWTFCATNFHGTAFSPTTSARTPIKSPRNGARMCRARCCRPTAGLRWATACPRPTRRSWFIPSAPSSAIVGDGGFQMTAGELSLARRLNLAVPLIILNDGWLGLMKVKQERKNYALSGVHLGAPPESPAHYFGVPCRAGENTSMNSAPRSIGRSPSMAQPSSKRLSTPAPTLRRFSIEPRGSR